MWDLKEISHHEIKIVFYYLTLGVEYVILHRHVSLHERRKRPLTTLIAFFIGTVLSIHIMYELVMQYGCAGRPGIATSLDKHLLQITDYVFTVEPNANAFETLNSLILLNYIDNITLKASLRLK